MPRYLVVPPDQIVPDVNQRVSFLELMQTCWLNDRRFGLNTFAMRAQQRLTKAFEGKKVGDEVEMTDEDWAILKQSADTPQIVNPQGQVVEGYVPQRIKQTLVFVDVIANAGAEPKKSAEASAAS